MISSFYRAFRNVNLNRPASALSALDGNRARHVGKSLSTVADYSHNLKELEDQGYSVLKNVFSATEITQMNNEYELLREKAMSIINNKSNERERVWRENNEETRSKYWCQLKENTSDQSHDIILQAGVGRYDLWKGFHLNVESPILDNIIDSLLSSHIHYSGIVISTPGSSDQYWHRDVDNLSNSNDTSGQMLMSIDDFYYTMLIPCSVDVTLQNGPTEFMVKSHKATANEFDTLEHKKAIVSMGDVLVFNGKMNHRGLGNRTGDNGNGRDGNDSNDGSSYGDGGGEERPVVYKVYHRPWYSDNYRAGVAEN